MMELCSKKGNKSMARTKAAALTLFIVVISSCITLTFTSASCDTTSSPSLAEQTGAAPTVVAGTIQQIEDDGFTLKVMQVLKGDLELRKKKIKILFPAAVMAPTQQVSRGTLVSATPLIQDSTVALTPHVSAVDECLGGATVGDRYIVFAQKVGTSKRKYEMMFEGVPQTKKAIKTVKDAVEKGKIVTTDAATTTTVAQTTDAELSTIKEIPDGNATNTTYQTSDAHIEECPENYKIHYCLNNGVCQWISGINKASCVCYDNYQGVRCELKALEDTHPQLFGDYWEVFIIGTIFGLVVLLTLIGAIVYLVRKRKQTQASRTHQQLRADEYIQSNYPLNDAEQPDANQNNSSDKYAPVPSHDADAVMRNECETLETAFADSKGSNATPFKLQEPPFNRKASSNSVQSKVSTV